MQVLHLTKDSLEECITRAAKVLRAGGIIVYPTDTLYGLGTDALSDKAVGKIYAIKGRDESKPIHAVFSDLAMVEKYAEVHNTARCLAQKFLPGPLTMILKKKSGVNDGIAKGIDAVGIRIPKNTFCLELARVFGKPYTATSANKADETPELTIEKILEQLGDSARMIDVAIDAGILPLQAPSTVVNLVSGSPAVLREGAILSTEIFAAL